MTPTPKFSICHTTARPEAFLQAYTAWMEQASLPQHVEYVLCVDRRWGFTEASVGILPERVKVVWNDGRKCAVDGWNTAFKAATGDVLVMASDDLFPSINWDIDLLAAINGLDPTIQDFAIRVRTENPNQARDLFGTIISRARYQRLGYALYPEYDGVCADDDDCEHIKLDAAEGRAILIDTPLKWHEVHPSFSGQPTDAVYEHMNRPEAYQIGAAILQRRRAAKFANTVSATASIQEKCVGLCLPGETFSGTWLAGFAALFSGLIQTGWNVLCFMSYSSQPSITRSGIVKAVIDSPIKPKYLLWLDDDNTLTLEGFNNLVADMELHTGAGAIGGWSWILGDTQQPKEALTSCGALQENSCVSPCHPSVFLDGTPKLLCVDYTGFPAVLMRTDVAIELGALAFAPIPCPASRWGFVGEDVAWCIKARAAGYTVLVDTRVNSPHLKLRALVGPEASDLARAPGNSPEPNSPNWAITQRKEENA